MKAEEKRVQGRQKSPHFQVNFLSQIFFHVEKLSKKYC